MTVREAIELLKEHQKTRAQKETRKSYGYLFRNLDALLGDSAVLSERCKKPLELEMRCTLAAGRLF